MTQLSKVLTPNARHVSPIDLNIDGIDPSEYRLLLIKCPANIQINTLQSHRIKLCSEGYLPYQTLNDGLKLSFKETSELKKMKVLVPDEDRKHFKVKNVDFRGALVEPFKTSNEKEDKILLQAKRKFEKDIEKELEREPLPVDAPLKSTKKRKS